MQQQGQVKRIFDEFTRRSGLILTKWTEKNTDNVWIRNATLEKQIDNLLKDLHSDLQKNINNNTIGAWEASNLKNDDLLKAFIKDLALPQIIGQSKYEKLEKGKLTLSKPMQDYHPGQGRYRSSYMNALRVAVTETNQSYHTADHERWKNQGFVLGIEVHRSKSNKGACAICDPMVGKYPPDYKFVGNHPFCICPAVPIMLEDEEFIDYLLTGEVPQDKIITTVPQSAINSVNKNEAK